jgi:alkylated DNA repair dioxygenase AlkB
MGDLPVKYTPNWLVNHQEVFNRLWEELAWVRVGNTPRREYYCNDVKVPYTYGKGAGVREYGVQPYHADILNIKSLLENEMGCAFEACFLNGYQDGTDHLGWHADDSPEMDDKRPIAIVSLGATREIWFRKNPNFAARSVLDGLTGIQGNINLGETMNSLASTHNTVDKVSLESGSLCLMYPGMQDTHHHRIPKSSLHVCGPRISLTFRGYVDPV